MLVIGGGSGGVRAARRAAKAGGRVMIAEMGALGGTCVNVGCVPKKLFVYAASFRGECAAAPAFGWSSAQSGAMHWDALRENKNHEIRRLNAAYDKLLQDSGVELAAHKAELLGENRAQVGGENIQADKILLATGASPTRANMPGAELAMLSDDMFFLPSLPKRAAVVGGGYIALEFAGILAGLGAETTLCHRADLPLRGFDMDVRAHLAKEICKRGVNLRAGIAPSGLEKHGDGIRLRFADDSVLDSDLVLMATGRAPKTAALGLENTPAKADSRGFLEVDDDYRVANCKNLFAIGDIINTPALTPVATAEAEAFVSRMFGGDAQAKVDYANLPTAVFSRPPLATVGLSEEAAAKKGIATKVYKNIFRPMKSGFGGSDSESLYKLVVAADSGRVLGAHLVGDDAGEIIQGIAVAIRMGATKADFDSTIGVHPTSAEELVTMGG